MQQRRTNPSMIPHRYFTQDPIDNLLIRVTLKKSRNQSDLVSAGRTTFKALMLKLKRQRRMKAELEASPTPLLITAPTKPQTISGAEPPVLTPHLSGFTLPQLKEAVLEKTFSWQQKVYTAREVLCKCHNKHVSKSLIDRTYEADIRALMKTAYKSEETESASRSHILQQGGVMLATKVDVDDYIHPSELKENVTTSSNQSLNALASSKLLGTRTSRQDRFTKMTVVACVDLPDHESDIKHYAKVQRCGFEQILYQIRFYDNGTFEISPQFSMGRPDNSEPHEFRSPGGVWYEYWLENVSQSIEKESELNWKKHRPKPSLAQSRMANLPNDGYICLNVFGEIQQSVDVPGDNLWVIYQLHVPEGWQWSKHDAKRVEASITQISTSTEFQQRRVCHFQFPIEFELTGRTDSPVFSWPTIYFQVMSTDFWECDRAEGYTSIQVPAIPGCHQLEGKLWRPTGTSKDAVRRFFLGGTPVLNSIFQAGLPPQTAEKGIFNRYGFSTIETGSLMLRLNVVITVPPPAIAEPIRPAAEPSSSPLRIAAAVDQTIQREKAILDTIESLRRSTLPEPQIPLERRSIGVNRRLTIIRAMETHKISSTQ